MSSAAGAIGLYMLVRWLVKAAEQPKGAPPPVEQPPIITPPPQPSPLVLAPVVTWTEPRELLAWRAWRLGFLLHRAGGDGGPRLLSIAASCIWNGPVVRDGVPITEPRYPSGIYALKPDAINRFQWHAEHCWITGTIALSGRVVEHALGYRAERAVVRGLRLGVATHLAVRSLKQLRQLMDALEDRYQVAVDVGQQEREIADRMRTHGALEPSKIPFVWDRHPWRLI